MCYLVVAHVYPLSASVAWRAIFCLLRLARTARRSSVEGSGSRSLRTGFRFFVIVSSTLLPVPLDSAVAVVAAWLPGCVTTFALTFFGFCPPHRLTLLRSLSCRFAACFRFCRGRNLFRAVCLMTFLLLPIFSMGKCSVRQAAYCNIASDGPCVKTDLCVRIGCKIRLFLVVFAG